ncbi:hypothetical protein F5884DRAFT_698551 [Xylogone sp. PMI_703]|nr:hypothetical protein F5884DRAFT_698551 [Xylogone sp. PMI_703]
MLGHTFYKALKTCLSKSQAPLLELDMLSEQERSLIYSLNKEIPIPPASTTLHTLFSQQAEATPDAIAVDSWDGQWTYAKLETLSNSLSKALLARGVGPEVPVPLCFEKSKWMIVSELAVLKAGGVCLPLTPQLPEDRIRNILSQVNTPVIIASEEHLPKFRSIGALQAASVSSLLHESQEHFIERHGGVESKHAAFVMFTSGSSGVPKGVIQTHGAICASLLEVCRAVGTSSKSRILQFAPFTFDVSITDIFSALVTGATVCIPSESDRLNNLNSYMKGAKVNQICCTAAVLSQLSPDDLPDLQRVAVGGDPLTKDLVRIWAHRVELSVLFGTTESAVWDTIAQSLQSDSDPTNIGRAIGISTWVVHPRNDKILQNFGAVGELLIEGDLSARGYINDSKKTGEVFKVDLPWAISRSRDKSTRFYKTGDLVRYTSNGTLKFIGRKDFQVKLRGQRIELGEVEHHLRAYLPESLSLAVELVTPKGQERPILAAFLCPHSRNPTETDPVEGITEIDVENVRSMSEYLEPILGNVLPQHMIPTVYIALAYLPRTVTGKINRKELRNIASALPLARLRGDNIKKKKITEPESKTETVLRRFWSKILNIPETEIGRFDAFNRLGGDSLHAMRLVAEARTEGLSLTTRDILDTPLLADLATKVRSANIDTQSLPPFQLLRTVDAKVALSTAEEILCVGTEQIEDIYPATPLQEALIMLSIKQPGTYISRTVFELSPEINIERFKRAWDSTVLSNPILRTRLIHLSVSELAQVVLRGNLSWNSASSVESYISQDEASPMGLGDPLCRLGLISTFGGQNCFALTLHHSIYDGWSTPLLLRAVAQYYYGQEALQTTPYNVFIQYLQSKDTVLSANWWSSQWEGFTSDHYPRRAPKLDSEPVRTSAIIQKKVEFPELRPKTISITTAIRAAWALCVGIYTNSQDVAIGITSAGRSAPVAGIDTVTGPTITTHPLRVRFEDLSETIMTFLERLQNQGRDVLEHEHLGLQNIGKLSQYTARASAVDNLLIIQPIEDKEAMEQYGLFNRDITHLDGYSLDHVTYSLLLEVALETGGARITAGYDPRIMTQEETSSVVGLFEHILIQLLHTDPTQLLQQINYVSPHDRSLMEQWNGVLSSRQDVPVYEIIREHSIQSPSVEAVCAWDGSFSYAELLEYSFAFAKYLRRLGVGEGDFIPLSFEKSKWYIVAMLGVWMAGAAFTPIDPQNPQKRTATLLERTGAKVVVVSRMQGIKLVPLTHDVIVLDEVRMVSLLTEDSSSNWECLDKNPASAAYCFFTSGSTGVPKGVIIEHGALATSILAHGSAMGLSKHSRMLHFTSCSFDASLTEIVGTLVHGGCICIPSEEGRMGNIEKAMVQFRVNCAFFTPTVARLLSLHSVPGLELVALGGEAVDNDLLRSLTKNGVRVVIVYGPTEATIWSHVNSSILDGYQSAKIGNAIGKAFGSCAWIVSPEDVEAVLPVGAIGELIIEGHILARGYLKDDKQTKEKFIDAPSWLRQFRMSDPSVPSSHRVYKTGDLALFNHDGSMQYIGRADSQVKFHGHRIELAEIEHHLRGLLEVDGSKVPLAVELVKTEGRIETLAAFISLDETTELECNDHTTSSYILQAKDFSREPAVLEAVQKRLQTAKESLARVLPHYMIPSSFILMRALPRTPAGKLDRKSLREVVSQHSIGDLEVSVGSATTDTNNHNKRAPTSLTERDLQELWAEVLGLDPTTIFADDEFFQKGADSIGAMRLSALARRRGITLTVANIFKYPRLENMAQFMQIEMHESSFTDPGIEPFVLLDETSKHSALETAVEQCNLSSVDCIEDLYPCTPLQEGIMAETMQNPGTYIARNIFELPAGVDLSKLADAWGVVYENNQILRTRFILSPEFGSYQVVLKPLVESSSILATGNIGLEEFLEADRAHSMAAGEPLCRFAVVRNDRKRDYKSDFLAVLSIHHFIYDIWSLELLAQQIHRVYSDQEKHVTSPKFSQFIRSTMAIDTEAARHFWRIQFEDCVPASHPLGTGISKKSGQAIYEAYKYLIQHEGGISGSRATLSTFIRAAWALVLAKGSNSFDVTFGATVSGRNEPVTGIDEMVGPTIATVPMRIIFDENDNIGDALLRIQEQGTNMIPYQQLGLQNIRKLSNSAKAACDFQSLLIVQPPPSDKDKTGVLAAFRGPVDDMHGFNTYPLMLECMMESKSIELNVNFDSSIVSRREVQHAMQLFEHILHQLLQASDGLKVKEIDSLPSSDLDQIKMWNRTVPDTCDKSIVAIISDHCKTQPERPIICAWDGEMSYERFDEVTTALAHHLVANGVRKETFVPLCFEKSIWMPVSIIAVLKAGGAFVPLEASHPAQRIMTISAACNSRIGLASAEKATVMRSCMEKVITVDYSLIKKLQKDQLPHLPQPALESAAYAIFTSGTTGVPKGVVIQHSSLATSVLAHGVPQQFSSRTRALAVCSYAFDASLTEIMTTMAFGGCICIPPDEARLNDLISQMIRLEVNLAFLTPSFARTIPLEDVPTLQTVVLGGEAISKSDVQRFSSRFQLVNGFGPSETTMCCAAYVFPRSSAGEALIQSVPIGTATGCVTWLVNPSDYTKLAPVFSVAELLVEGPIVARGYLNDPEKTAASFIQGSDIPWFREIRGPAAGSTRLYRTGDLVRYNDDGTMQYFGRKDTQVKVRGQRVELGEVEMRILEEANVGTAVVDVIKLNGDEAEASLVAFVCKTKMSSLPTNSHKSNGHSINGNGINGNKELSNLHASRHGADLEEGVINSLAEKLPSYMVPSMIILVEEIPLTSSQKIDRSRLLDLAAAHLAKRHQNIRNRKNIKRVPTNAIEAQLQQIWARVLNIDVESIGIEDPFISLSGDSISAMQVASRARAAGIRLSAQQVLKEKTIARMALVSQTSLRTASHSWTSSDFNLLQPMSGDDFDYLLDTVQRVTGSSNTEIIEDIYPVTATQEGMLVSQTKDDSTYNVRSVFLVLAENEAKQTPIDPQRLAMAWETVVSRHHSLRALPAMFSHTGGEFIQIVLNSTKPTINLIRCRDDQIDTMLEAEESGFDKSFKTPRLLHTARIYHTDTGRVYFSLEIDHVLIDRMSLTVMLRELSQAYNREALPPAPSFKDFVEYLKRENHTTATKTFDYWSNVLQEAERCFLPLPDDCVTARDSVKCVGVKVPSRPEIDAFCTQNQITLSSLFQAAWSLVLHIYTGSDDISFGYLTSGRDTPLHGIENAVGVFISMLVCRMQLDSSISIGEMLEQIQQKSFEAMQNQYISLAELHRAAGIRDGALFSTVMTVRTEREVKDIDGKALQFHPLNDQAPTEYDVTISVSTPDSVSLTVDLDYWAPRITPAYAQGLAESLANVICCIISAPKQSIAKLDIIGDYDIQRLHGWNREKHIPVEKTVHSLIEMNAQVNPDALAVVGFEGSFTYKDLDAHASCLAAYLVKEKHIGPGSNVPLCFEKSAWTIVAILAVLKAGAAFVPMDAAFVPRMKTIIEIVDAKLVLASKAKRAVILDYVDEVVEVSRDTIEDLKSNGYRQPNVQVKPTDIAYILFTSGSTGVPKGAVMAHRSYCSNVEPEATSMHISKDSRVLSFASYSFGASRIEILTTLCIGGTVCVPSDQEKMDDPAGAINRMHASWVLFTPSFARILDPQSVPTLKTVVLGGEAVTQDLLDLWATVPGKELIEVYGQAESSSTSCYHVLKPDSDPKVMGRPVGANYWLINPQSPEILVPIGALGEIVVEGPNVTNGYWNDHAKTASSFIKPPEWLKKLRGRNVPLRHLYRTGDLARFTANGMVRTAGRRDTQVKVRGQRIELAEVEYHIKQCLPPSSSVTVEAVVPKGSAGTLVSFIILKAEELVGLNESAELLIQADSSRAETFLRDTFAKLRSQIETRLPSYMVPSAFAAMSRFPLTVTGKTSRKGLREMATELTIEQLGRYSLDNTLKRVPESPMEKMIQSLWAEVLQYDQNDIFADDHFLGKGGDSISAIRLSAAARKRSILLGVSQILSNPVLKNMAMAAEPITMDTTETAVIRPFSLLVPNHVEQVIESVTKQYHIEKDSIEDLYPCTPLQEGMMMLSARSPGLYVFRHAFVLADSIDAERLKLAWGMVIQANETLRTIILTAGSLGCFQAVLNKPTAWLHSSSLSDYLRRDRSSPMEFGDDLLRLSLVIQPDGQRFCVWTVHHSIFDGWSTPLILSQVDKAYHSQMALPESVRFNRFIKYVLERDEYAATQFWKQELHGAHPAAFPPTSDAVGGGQEKGVATVTLPLKEEQKSDTTLALEIRLAWAIILARYSNDEDVTFGVTLSGRTVPVSGIENISGPTIVTVPVRVRVEPEKTVREALQQLQDQEVRMMPFEQTGMQKIQGLDTHTATACDFRTLVLIQPKEFDDINGVLGELHDSTDTMAAFNSYPLMLQFSIGVRQVELEASFDQDVMSAPVAMAILRQLMHVLHQIHQNDSESKRVKDLILITEEDESLISSWNKPTFSGELNHMLHFIEEMVRIQPDRTAVHAWDGSATYGELFDSASRVGVMLREMGVGPETLVPICFEKSKFVIIVMLGIWIAGGAFVPLDPSTPEARLKDIFDDTKATMVLTSHEQSRKFSSLVGEVVIIDEEVIRKQVRPLPDPESPTRPETLAYVIFTSGTTGRPKGISIEHGALSSSLRQHARQINMTPTTRALHFTSSSFDASITETIGCLVFGGCICIPSELQKQEDITAAMEIMDINWAFFTPSVARMIALERVQCLRTLVLGGEKAKREDIQRWTKTGTMDLKIVYGPTENSIWCMVNDFAAGPQFEDSIGKASGCVTWIAEPDNPTRLAPVGAVGELILEGPGLARGYLNDIDKTNAAFIPHPQWIAGLEKTSAKVYRTGDLVSYNPDGSIKYIGRKDEQVKLHGHRIELGEVEFHIRRCLDGIKDIAATVLMPNETRQESQDPVLAAFVVFCLDEESSQIVNDANILKLGDLSTSSQSLLTSQLDNFDSRLAAVLPRYMMPTTLIAITSMPVSTAGKTDKKRLKQLISENSLAEINLLSITGGKSIAPPVTEAEILLQRLWAQILGMKQDFISRDDEFFKKGGESIKAMYLSALVRAEGLKLSVPDIFKNNRLSDMALQVESEGVRIDETPTPFALIDDESERRVKENLGRRNGIKVENIEDVYPATPMQSGLLALSSRFEGAYIRQDIYELPLGVNIEQFKTAWESVAGQHSILRTRIISLGPESHFQVVLNESIQWQLVADVEAFLQSEKASPMGLGDPLVRYGIHYSNESCRYQFIWTIHHALFDGWSLSLLLGAVDDAYQQRALKPPVPFNVFVKHLVSGNSKEHKAFWASELSGTAAEPFPRAQAANQKVVVDSILERQFRFTRIQASNITTSTILRAAWALCIAQYSYTPNPSEVIFGITSTGRTISVRGIESITGPTIATVPFRVSIEDKQPVNDFLHELQQKGVQMIEHEQIGLQSIQRLSSDATRAVDFRSLLVIQPEELSLNSDSLFAKDKSAEFRKVVDFTSYPLTLDCTFDAGRVALTAIFDNSAIEHQQMDLILQNFENLFQQMCHTLDGVTIGDLNAISDADKTAIRTWNSHEPKRTTTFVQDMIDQRALEYPDKIAVSAWDGEWTYGELQKYTDLLAAKLKSMGVEPGNHVVSCLEKSKYNVIATVATWKAAGVLVPMDPKHPVERRLGIAEQVEPPVALLSYEQFRILSQIAPYTIIVNESLLKDLESSQLPLRDIPSVPLRPESTAYIVFTSGSTGIPKGVVIPHDAFSSSVTGLARTFGVQSSSRVLNFASHSFDASILEIATPLIQGGTVCIPSEEGRMSSLEAAMDKLEVNWAFFTPGLLRLLTPGKTAHLKTVVVGGEAIERSLLDRWKNQVRLFVAYGPTEVTIICAAHDVTANGSHENIVGTMASECKLWVVDPEHPHRLQPVGATGELVIEGPVLAVGYHNDKQKTDAAFITSSGWLQDGEQTKTRAYMTGDLVRYNSEGVLLYVARKNAGQVKYHGQRLEIGEIESHVRRIGSEAMNVAVDVVAFADRKDVLTLFLHLKNRSDEWRDDGEVVVTGEEIPQRSRAELVSTFSSLENQLSAAVPQYMVPTAIVLLKFMPTSTTGKIDRGALHRAAAALPLAQANALVTLASTVRRQPSNKLEFSLQMLWAKVLSLPSGSIDANDHFFRLGGHSLAAMDLVGQAREQGLHLTVADVFSNPVLSEMALVAKEVSMQEMEDDPNAFELLPLDLRATLISESAVLCNVGKDEVEDVYPCTPLQEGLMAISARTSGSYIAKHVFELPLSCDVQRLRDAWQVVFTANGILRTRIVEVHGGLYQVVLKNRDINWKLTDSLEHYLEDEEAKTMGLGQPLNRFAIIRETNRFYCVWTAHHSIYDGWSLSQVAKQVEQAYSNVPLSPTGSYSRFIRYIRQANIHEQESFWRQTLEGTERIAFPALPSPGYKPSAEDLFTCNVPLRMNGSSITAATLISLAWGMVVARHAGAQNEDVVFGSTLSGRNAPVYSIESITGPTLATIPLRVQLDRTSSVPLALQQLQKQLTDTMAFEQLGIQNIRCASQSASDACDFQNLLLIQPRTDESIEPGVLHNLMGSGALKLFNNYPLMVQCSVGVEEIEVAMSFDSFVLPHEEMGVIASHFRHVLDQLMSALNDDAMKLEDIQLTDHQDLQMLQSWNAHLPPSEDMCAHHMIERICADQPHQLAVSAWDGDLTYKELDQLSSSVALQLVRSGVGPEVMVPTCFEKSKWAIVAVLAIWKAGGAFVPLDPSHTTERGIRAIQQTGARVMVSSRASKDKYAAVVENIIILDDASIMTLPSPDSTFTNTASKPSDKAYVIFTSGSTGIPKGVIIEHAALTTSAMHHGSALGFSQKTRALHFTSPSFDASITEFAVTLLFGGCICIPSEDERRNHLIQVMDDRQVNWAFFTPTVASSIPVEEAKYLDTLILGGEAVPMNEIERLLPHTNLRTVYGPTEMTIWCTVNEPAKAQFKDSIGRGTGVATWVVEQGNPDRLAPMGCVGELLLEGPLIARGYLNDESKTKAAFIPAPAWLQDLMGHERGQGLLYRTGDIVKYNSDGSIKYIGRSDNQVKLRGHRIELGEVEYHLTKALTEMDTVVVEVITPKGGVPTLAAFLFRISDGSDDESPYILKTRDATSALRNNLTIQLQSVEDLLSTLLPHYSIPSTYVILRRVPLTTSGKTDRKAIRQLASDISLDELDIRQTSSAAIVTKRQPETYKEQQLQRLWAKILRATDQSNIGVDDNFFRAGGDSISAMKLVAELRNIGIMLTVSNIFENPTLSEMAASAQISTSSIHSETYQPFSALRPAHSELPLQQSVFSSIPFQREQVEDVYPATGFQEMAISAHLQKARGLLNFIHLDFDAALDIERLQEACRSTMAYFESLRSVFVMHNAAVFQVVIAASAIPLHFDQFETQHDIDDFCEELRASEFNSEIHFGHPMIRFYFVQHGKGRQRLVIRISHAQYDGISLPQVIEHLRTAYHNNTLNKSLTVPFSHFAAHTARSNASTTSLMFWKHLLDGASMTQLVEPSIPTYSRNADQTIMRETLTTTSTSELQHVTFANVLKAAWAFVLSQATNKNEVVFGSLISGRNASVVGIESIVGACINIVPVRVKFSEEKVIDILRQVQDQQLAAIPHEQLNFRNIVANCTDWPSWTRFTSIVQHQNIDEAKIIPWGNSECAISGYSPRDDETDIWVLSSPSSQGRTEIRLSYNSSTFSFDLANELLDSLVVVVEMMLKKPEESFGGLPSLTQLHGTLPVQISHVSDPSLST